MKVWNYIILCTVIILMVKFIGLTGTGIDGNQLVNTSYYATTNSTQYIESFTISNIFKDLFTNTGFLATLAVIALASVTVGYFNSNVDTLGAIKAGIAIGIFYAFNTTIYSLLSYAISNEYPAWIVGIEAIIFIPLTIGYIVALVEFLGGTD